MRYPTTKSNPFLSDLRRFVAEIAPFGGVNALAQVVLKLTSPGVPDLYQGCEDWFHAVVDPDNRRPVDFTALQQRLAAALAPDAVEGLSPCGGLHKLHVTAKLLHWRRDQAEALLRDGSYVPLAVRGTHAAHVVAYMRCLGDACAVVVVPRLTWQVSGGSVDTLLDAGCWDDTEVVLPDGAAPVWERVLLQQRVSAASGALRVAAVLRDLPVAVLRNV